MSRTQALINAFNVDLNPEGPAKHWNAFLYSTWRLSTLEDPKTQRFRPNYFTSLSSLLSLLFVRFLFRSLFLWLTKAMAKQMNSHLISTNDNNTKVHSNSELVVCESERAFGLSFRGRKNAYLLEFRRPTERCDNEIGEADDKSIADLLRNEFVIRLTWKSPQNIFVDI